MWIRIRLDISWFDLAYGILACFFSRDASGRQQRAERHWSDDALACLSVRSGFDLLLRALQLPARSEVLLSALTVPDMVRIVEQHNLVPVPVDLVEGEFTPCLHSLERAITPATRIVVVAHLFGARTAMEPILELARRHKLLVVEDCAQAYCGRDYFGHPQADVSLFSFGPIKTATALGGGVVRVRDPAMRGQMRREQSRYRVQSRWAYLGRLLKYSVLKAFSARPVFSAVARLCAALGFDNDTVVSGVAHNFPERRFFHRVRQRPSAPLLSLMLRRWRHYDPDRLRQRAARGEFAAQRLGISAASSDSACAANTYWVFPILVNDPPATLQKLREAGFDATRQSRLDVVAAPDGRHDLDPRNVRATLSRIVFLPWYPELPSKALNEMLLALQREGERQRDGNTSDNAASQRGQGVAVRSSRTNLGQTARRTSLPSEEVSNTTTRGPWAIHLRRTS